MTVLLEKKLSKLCKSVQFCDALQFSINKQFNQYVLEISLPKQQLPYFISFLSFHQYSIFQVLSPKKINELLDFNNYINLQSVLISILTACKMLSLKTKSSIL